MVGVPSGMLLIVFRVWRRWWTSTASLPVSASHPFYQRLNQILNEKKSTSTSMESVVRPGLSPGIYFRLLMVGYFEGIDSERGIAWRASCSLSIRSFVRPAGDESVPDHSTIFANQAADGGGNASGRVSAGAV